MSVEALTWAFKRSVGDPIAKLVLIAIADHANEHGECWPSRRLLAIYAECSVDTVDRRMKDLIEKGLIEKEARMTPRGDTSNMYRLIMAAANGGQPPIAAGPAAQHSGTPSRTPAAPRNRNGTINGTKSDAGVATGADPFADVDGSEPDLDGIPLELKCDEFATAWAEWKEYRKQRKKPLTPISIAKQLAALKKIGLKRAVAAIDHSIANNYQGIYEPKGNENTKGNPPVSPRTAIHGRQDIYEKVATTKVR